jgi:predicted HicB family RNase H-like nuclease
MMTNDAKISFTLRINSTIDEKLTQASKELGISKNAIVNMALHEKFKGGEAKENR